ncbi:MAG: FGGY family carbohydrate kinase [Enterobacteriaceae bacterium]
MARYYLGLDQGTTGTTALILDQQWQIAGRGYAEHSPLYPQSGWVEKDPQGTWRSLLQAVTEALKHADCDGREIACIGMDNEGETCMVWDKNTGQPVYNAIVWQDRRTSRYADQLAEEYGALIRERTGLVVDAYFSATKIKWILDNVPGVRERALRGELLAGTLDAWLMWKLTHGALHATDHATASRIMLLNIHSGQWDQEILDILQIPATLLPAIHNSSDVYADTDPLDFFGYTIPITGNVVDQQAALFGQACFSPGMVKTTYGTGCFMLMNTGEQPVYSDNGLLTTIGWSINNQITYALDGGIYIAGAAVQWLRDKLQIISTAAQVEELALQAKDTGGLYFVPAFAGLAAPHWDQYARGTMVGITSGTSREQIALATLGIGDFTSLEELAANWQLARRFEPRMSDDERESRLYHWHRAVERCKGWEQG